MNLITLDFETYYDKTFSLRKMTTEAYIRDPRFEVIGVGVKLNNEETEWASGTHGEIKAYLEDFNWDESFLLAHNTMFDGSILSWIFGINPRVYADTMCMGRAVHGVETSVSLASLAKLYGLGAKGGEIQNTVGKGRNDFTDAELDKFGDYCINDVELTYGLFKRMAPKFPKKEMHIIDKTLRMFTQPMIDLDLAKLEKHLDTTRHKKEQMLKFSGLSREELMSNPKFAKILEEHGVKPPMKKSPANGKMTFAFAKTDEKFTNLLDHDNFMVQTLVTTRLGVKSTLEETRTERFIDIAKRGLLPVPIRYYAAHTGRWGGDDKINIQNLPSRGENGKVLKKCIVPPDGYTLIDCDSSQIEARVLAWVAGQKDLVKAFTNKEDVYIKMASSIYGVPESEVTKEQRFVGKTTILGCGYGMGSYRFQDQLATFGVDISIEESRRIVKVYRETNDKIVDLWQKAQNMLVDLVNKDKGRYGTSGIIKYKDNGILLPSGIMMQYEDIKSKQEERGLQFDYKSRRGRTKIYGGKVIENVCQAFARCIIAEQMLKINKKHRVVLTVHDSLVCCVLDDEVTEAKHFIEECMRETPEWAEGLPLDCEAFTGKSYGDCEE